nr:class C sortase [uncultured Anaerobutyricum sp.]
MKSKILGILITLFFAGGYIILNYPVFGTLYNQVRGEKVLKSYDEAVQTIDEGKRQKYLKEAQDYNKMLIEDNPQLSDAFSQEEKKADSAYNHVLNMEESGVMGALEIPKISVYLPIYHGTSQEVLERGVGHLEGTSIPIGGKDTHAVLTGHRGLPSAELFSNLDQLERNDKFYIHILGEILAYKVFNVETVRPEETGHLAIAKGQDRVTLVTCTPYGINTHRLLIHAKRIPYTDQNTNSEKSTLWKWLLKQRVFLVSTAVGLLLLSSFIRSRKKKKKKKPEIKIS